MALVVTAISLTACDPNDPVQRQAFYDLNPAVSAEDLTVGTMNEAQRAVVKALQDRQTAFYLGIIAAEQDRARLSTDCVAAMQAVWPATMHPWALGIMKRESGFYHAAANSSSSARGCWQLLPSLHADKYAAAGCHVSRWADAHCNNRAAYVLYQQAGTSPWRL
jgi:hypothetical protein